MIEINNYTEDLILDRGIYFTKNKQNISYPQSGNQDCFQIEENSFWFKHRNNCIVTLVKKYSFDKHFFDIGGGNGYVAKRLEQEGVNTVLIEPGIQGCLNAQKRRLENIVCSTLESASFKKGTIPSVGLFDVVEHIKDDIAFLTDVYNYLEKDGFIYITVPAYQFLWSNEDTDAGHYRRYTRKELETKLEKIGFEILHSTYIFTILPLPIWLTRTLPSKLGLNKNPSDLKKHKKSHSEKIGFVSKIVNKIWNSELNNIAKGKENSFGGSCLVVAKKK
jgi:hypothetical protein